MGVEISTELPDYFQDITNWPKSRVESVLKSYGEGEFDFGIDYMVVMTITGYEINEAKALVKAHAKNDSGIINAITLLISIIALGNSENRNEIGRLESIFNLMDFSHSSQISMDELTILLLCVASSFSFILNETPTTTLDEDKKDNLIMNLSKRIYESLGKKSNIGINKDELIKWVKDNFFSQGITNINDIFRALYEPPAIITDNSNNEE